MGVVDGKITFPLWICKICYASIQKRNQIKDTEDAAIKKEKNMNLEDHKIKLKHWQCF